jgi:hypothetical protein
VTETELAKPVIAWLELQHWDVYQEVQFSAYGRVADIVAVRNKCIWMIECKVTLSLAVIEQAYMHRGCHMRSVAVPSCSGSYFKNKILETFGIGLIGVDKPNYKGTMAVSESIHPGFVKLPQKKVASILAKLLPEHKTMSAAGSPGGGHFTPYMRTMKAVREYITRYPGCTIGEIIGGIEWHHYASDKGAKSTIKKALEKWENDWCRVEQSGKEPRYFIM